MHGFDSGNLWFGFRNPSPRAMGSEFMVRVQDVCFSVKFAGFECSVHYLRVRVWVWDALCGLRVKGLGFRVWDFGFGGSG